MSTKRVLKYLAFLLTAAFVFIMYSQPVSALRISFRHPPRTGSAFEIITEGILLVGGFVFLIVLLIRTIIENKKNRNKHSGKNQNHNNKKRGRK